MICDKNSRTYLFIVLQYHTLLHGSSIEAENIFQPHITLHTIIILPTNAFTQLCTYTPFFSTLRAMYETSVSSGSLTYQSSSIVYIPSSHPRGAPNYVQSFYKIVNLSELVHQLRWLFFHLMFLVVVL